jgi:hypothetical protein
LGGVGREKIKYSIANDDMGINFKNRRREYGRFFGHLPASVCTLRDGSVSDWLGTNCFPFSVKP